MKRTWTIIGVSDVPGSFQMVPGAVRSAGYPSCPRLLWANHSIYFIFRTLFNIVFGRVLLLNWPALAVQLAVGTCASYVAYILVIIPRKPLLPSSESIGEQLWLAIALFLYAAFNNIRTGVRDRFKGRTGISARD